MYARSLSWHRQARTVATEFDWLVVTADHRRASLGLSGKRIGRDAGAGSAELPVSLLSDARIATLDDPRALTGDHAGYWRWRIGDYRVVARIEDDRVVIIVVRVAHRREVYR